MPVDTPVLIILGGVAVAGGILVAQRLWLRRRAEAWARVSGRLGLTPRPAPVLPADAADLKTFSLGHKQRLRAGAEGASWGGDVLLADLEYITSYGRNRAVHRQTVCVIRDSNLNLPHFVMRPERALVDRVGALFGAADFDFDDDPAFSRAFVLAGDDETAVRSLFTASLRMQLTHLGDRRLFVEGRGPVLVLHHGRLVPPEEAGRLLEQAAQVAQMLRT